MPKRSYVRKLQAKVGFAPRTQLTINKQLKGDLNILFENSVKYVWQSGNAENKSTVFEMFFYAY